VSASCRLWLSSRRKRQRRRLQLAYGRQQALSGARGAARARARRSRRCDAVPSGPRCRSGGEGRVALNGRRRPAWQRSVGKPARMGRPASRTPSSCPSAARRLHNRLACGTVAERLLEALGEFHFRVGTVGSGRVGRRHGGVPAPRLAPPAASRRRRRSGVLRRRSMGPSRHGLPRDPHAAPTARVVNGRRAGRRGLVAHWCAQRNPGATVVALLPDQGWRCLDSVYDDRWLQELGVRLVRLPAAPTEVDHPREASGRVDAGGLALPLACLGAGGRGHVSRPGAAVLSESSVHARLGTGAARKREPRFGGERPASGVEGPRSHRLISSRAGHRDRRPHGWP
jgi:hypothetical protein